MSSPSIKQSPIWRVIALIIIGLGIGWLAGLSVSPVVSIVITSVMGSVAAIVAVLSGVKDELLDRETSPNTVRRWLKGVSPVPLAWLVVGLIAGAIIGICVRNHNWLGIDQSTILTDEITMWVEHGLDEKTVARRLFEAKYGYRGWLGQDLAVEITQWTTDTVKLDPAEVARRIFESTYPLESVSATAGNPSAGTNEPDIIPFTALKSAEMQQQARELCDIARTDSGSNLRSYVSDTITIQQVISLTTAISDDQMLKETLTILCTDG